MRQSKVLLVEDEPNARDRCIQIINEHPRLVLEDRASNYKSATDLITKRSRRYDLLLTDLQLGDGDGADLIKLWRSVGGKNSMVITVFGDVDSVMRAVEAGADGYLLKSGSNFEMQNAISTVLDGGAPISAAVAGHLLRRLRRDSTIEEISGEKPSLSPRETEILSLLARGHTVKEVATSFNISPHTVADHIKAIYRKLEVSSRSHAVFRAIQEGLIDL